MKATLNPAYCDLGGKAVSLCGVPYRSKNEHDAPPPVYPDAGAWCPQPGRLGTRLRKSPRRWIRTLIPLVALVVFSVLFVGADLLERYFADSIPTGMRHAVLTGLATILAGLVSAMVYLVMRRQQQQLAGTATKLTELLEAYRMNPQSAGRFENPHLVHCREVLACDRQDCPVLTAPGETGERCWQILALCPPGGSMGSPGEGYGQPRVSMKQCQECDVYKLSCPDEFSELGEGINNLLYLLEKGAGQIGRMRDQMVEKQKITAASQIAAGVAHEICNPLSSISAVVQMLRRHNQITSQTAQFDVIDAQIQRISKIVRQLIDLTPPNADEWERVDIAKTLDGIVEFLSFSPQARGVKIVFNRPENLPETFGHAGHLHQMVVHIVLNALDAMPSGGTLTLSAEVQDGCIVLCVHDTGAGIAGEVGRRVFEPFFTTKEPGRGTGLGLTVAYWIVQEHCGTIDFVSQPDTGTTFHVTIPVLSEAPEDHHG